MTDQEVVKSKLALFRASLNHPAVRFSRETSSNGEYRVGVIGTMDMKDPKDLENLDRLMKEDFSLIKDQCPDVFIGGGTEGVVLKTMNLTAKYRDSDSHPYEINFLHKDESQKKIKYTLKMNKDGKCTGYKKEDFYGQEKICKMAYSDDEMITREANNERMIDTKNIHCAYRYIDNKPLKIMSLISGKTVGSYISHLYERNEFTEAVFFKLLHLMLNEIKRIHQKGFSHGDPNLENFMYDEEKDQCKLIDFSNLEKVENFNARDDLKLMFRKFQDQIKFSEIALKMMEKCENFDENVFVAYAVFNFVSKNKNFKKDILDDHVESFISLFSKNNIVEKQKWIDSVANEFSDDDSHSGSDTLEGNEFNGKIDKKELMRCFDFFSTVLHYADFSNCTDSNEQKAAFREKYDLFCEALCLISNARFEDDSVYANLLRFESFFKCEYSFKEEEDLDGLIGEVVRMREIKTQPSMKYADYLDMDSIDKTSEEKKKKEMDLTQKGHLRFSLFPQIGDISEKREPQLLSEVNMFLMLYS